MVFPYFLGKQKKYPTKLTNKYQICSMSSHHVVRDNQEPALIIANGESCDLSLVLDLLEWSPTVVVLDGAMHRVLDFQIKCDVWLGDFDSVSVEEMSSHPALQHVEIVHTPDQDKTDLQKAIEFLIAKNIPAANIVWAGGRRTDHHLNNLLTLARYSEKITLTVIDNYGKTYVIPQKFKKWYKKGTQLSLIPCGIAYNVLTHNLVWNLTGQTLELPHFVSSSNEVLQDGFVEVNYTGGHILMVENWDA